MAKKQSFSSRRHISSPGAIHASTEASSDEVFDVFCSALESSVEMQHQVYKCMEDCGFYQIKQVPQTEIKTVQNKFEECCY